MNCEILRTLYLKANGEIVCNDDYGEQVSLGMPAYDRPRLGLTRILENEKFGHIRSSFAAGQVPWPGVCEHCALLRMHEPAGVDLLASKVIQKFQVEASLACALRCPDCANGAQMRARPGPVHLPEDWYRKILTELAEAGFHVSWIEFCGQGEPLNHPEFARLVEITREILPETRIRLITNGNHSFMRKVGSAFIDETIVSIDGARQQSYAAYRVKGQLDRALKFLEGSCDTQVPRGGNVIWKYILFSSNDSDEELRAAQDMAAEIGLTRLWFVHGHGRMVSQRFTFANALSPPVTRPFVKVESHPSYNNRSVSLNDVGLADHKEGPDAQIWLDRVVIHENGMMTLTGWANSADRRLETVGLDLPDGDRVEIPLEIARPDVIAAFPSYVREDCGFDVLVKAPGRDGDGTTKLVFDIRFGDEAVARLSRDIEVPGSEQPA
ncbi:radical SAM protein [Cribrihabitans sp. XS_ASV171]